MLAGQVKKTPKNNVSPCFFSTCRQE